MTGAIAGVAIAHDYLTVRGGAERVVLSLTRAFPDAPIYTALYDARHTFPQFTDCFVEVSPLNRFGALRRDHRRALPFLPEAWSRTRIEANAVICSSSGWAHGAAVTGRKIVYCHTPARWLYQPSRYLRTASPTVRMFAAATRRRLQRWDQQASATAQRYVANSRVVRDRIRDVYHRDADIVPPPHAMDADAPVTPLAGVEPGFWLTVARLHPYKNVDATIAAFTGTQRRLVVIGTGPDMERLQRDAPCNVTLVGGVTDAQLRWAYANCTALVATSYEDYGLTPLEAAAFGRPTVALRFGGYLDTVIDGATGVYIEEPGPAAIHAGVERLAAHMPDQCNLRTHAAHFSEASFIERMRAIVEDEQRVGGAPRLGAKQPAVGSS